MEVKRFDNIDNSEWMTETFALTSEGFLKGRAIVTSAGVFSYMQADGTMVRELRLPEEVFSLSTLESIKLKPVTLDHPSELVTSENAKELQVGSLGDNPSYTTQYNNANSYKELTDGINCAVDMVITRKDAIDAVLNGKQSLSMGYTCELEEAKRGATWAGVEYDYIQRNIRYNHCAIVDRARAGDNALINLRKDSRDAILQNRMSGGKTMLKKITLDGIEYEAEESVIKHLHDEKMRADNAEKNLAEFKKENESKVSKLQAECDTAKERADKAEEEVKSLNSQKLDASQIDALVQSRIELLRNAEKCNVEIKDGMSDIDIKKSIIVSQFPKANFDGKDETYIEARYDATIEMVADKNTAQAKAVVNDVLHDDSDDETKARNDMIARFKKQNTEETK